MCATCGCAGDGVVVRLVGERDGAANHEHASHEHASHEHASHEHDQRPHVPGGSPADGESRTVTLQRNILAKNDDIARHNRQWLADRRVLMLNLMSSPGAGKTTLLEHTGRALGCSTRIGVIEGDQETTIDAERVRAAGCEVVQVNTGAGCHLDGQMVSSALRALDPPAGSIVLVENVGNLVCPALFDLGEAARVVLSCVTEGSDKPAKYPQMFQRADLVVVSKIDLLPYVDFDTRRHAADVRRLCPAAEIIELSAVSGAGLADWYDWLTSRRGLPR